MMDWSRRARGLLPWLASNLLVLTPNLVGAQEDEVIVDPELAGSSSNGGAADDEVIADPELAGGDHQGWGEAARIEQSAPTQSAHEEHDPQANTGIARIEADGRFAADLHHEGDRPTATSPGCCLEDAYESRFRLDVEVEFRRSRKLRLSLGVRTDLLWAVPAGGDPGLNYSYTDYSTPGDENTTRPMASRHYSPFDQDRFELDIIPLSAYLDTTLGDGFHLRLGTQQVTMARTDFFSPVDILTVYDQRGQPRLDPGTPKIAQPAVRVDWDLSSWATLQIVYVPWFMPNLTRPSRDGYVAKQLGLESGTVTPSMDTLIDPSWQTKASESGARFVGPSPDFTTPQAQARLNFRGSSYELGLSGGTALEKVPAFYLAPVVEDLLQDRRNTERLANLLSQYDTYARNNPSPDLRLIDAEYHRFYQVGIDGSFDIAPITIAFELTYSPSRHYYAARLDRSMLARPNVTREIYDPYFDDQGVFHQSNVGDPSIRQGVPVVQSVLHLDWVHDDNFVLAVEGFWLNALKLPYDEQRDWWAFKRGTGAFIAGVLGATYRLNDGQWSFESSLIALMGPSFISVSQIELRVVNGFFLNVGAMIYEGQVSKPRAQSLSIGGLLSGYDQLFVGFRYLP